MVVDVLRQMRERLDADSQHQQALAARMAAGAPVAAHNPGSAGTADAANQVYAYRTPVPDDLWIRCPTCNGVMFREDFEKSHSVCTLCGFHYRLDSRTRLAQIADPDSFVEWDSGMLSQNPIEFSGYPDKISQLQGQTGLEDAVITGQARINGQNCGLAVMDGRFMMGSMGSVVGERITRLFERAALLRLPVITFAASGGARMQEGIVSLMQMAKTAAAVGRFQDAGLLYISVMTDPTTGGVTASFASLGDIILSEPGTLIGFAGRRVIEGTIAQALPEGFQRAEFLLEHGFLDLIVPRNRLKSTLADLLTLHGVPVASAGRTARKGNNRQPAAAAGQEDPGQPSPYNRRRSGSECLDLIRQKNRPVISDYLPILFDDFCELHGDRLYKEDPALWGGIARLDGRPVTIVGHRKGRTLEENTRFNFGMPHPEGYRKALRLMRQAEKFGRPVICLIDTSGAYCGVGAEERGQGEAIARNLREMMNLTVPVITVVTGEGGSGGALAIGIGDELAMLSNALYSVISPRGFASLLWKDPAREREAADVLHITAADLYRLGICDAIIEEPAEGAHSNHSAAAAALRAYLQAALSRQSAKTVAERLSDRYEKFRRIGSVLENQAN
ncbi:MAG TPA: acetyl-CoA carboxylase carboxyl transferase subunit beta [Clostridiales bacterium]|nr:acetyl-CoA carboxylase carboxyl transferase subunit beta [Clostridiales bacterium]